MLEKKWGTLKTVFIYFIAGIGGVLMSCLLYPEDISVGASGAILGLMGAFLAEIIIVWDQLGFFFKKKKLNN